MNISPRNYDVISINHYFDILKKNEELSQEEQKQVSDFDETIASEIEYEDYLLDPQRSFLNTYRQNIISLSIKEEENESSLTFREKDALAKYQQMNENVRNRNQENMKKLQKLNNDSSLGYANAFVVVLAVLAVGIIVGIAIFLSIQL